LQIVDGAAASNFQFAARNLQFAMLGPPHPFTPSVAAPFIRFDHVSKSYHVGEVEVHALREVSLELPEGELIVLLGPSGSGKTTLLNLVGGIDQPTAGTILVDGQDLGALDEERLTEYRRRTVGFVFQFFNLIPTLTARENVELVAELAAPGAKAPGYAGGRADSLFFLEAVGLGARADHFPGELSGGEQQRVAIARALAKRPRIILADEPTGNLDYETSIQVLKAFHEIRRTGRTMLMVTHNPVIGEMADRVIRMRSGEILSVHEVAEPVEPEELEW
jgi:putative ABC transport system ATP-binding protein